MLRRIAIVAVGCAVIISLGACARTLRLQLPADAPIELKTFVVSGVEAQPRSKLLQPSSPEYRRFQDWLARNQHGWSQSLATNPISGVFITAGDFRLQFTGNTALAFTDHGHFQKEVQHEDYAFLEAAIGI